MNFNWETLLIIQSNKKVLNLAACIWAILEGLFLGLSFQAIH